MAKSIRSKSKRAFRQNKRTNPKSDYAMADMIRTQRLSDKLKKSSISPTKDVLDEKGEMMEEENAGVVDEKPAQDDMGIDKKQTTQTKRISTSGPRSSSSERKRLKRGGTKHNRATFPSRKSRSK